MLVHNLISWLLLGLGLFGPGWLLNRALGTTAGALGAFLGSAAFLFNLVLVLDALDIPFTRLSLRAGVGDLAREYGLVFVGLGPRALARPSVDRRGRLKFLNAFTLVAAPSYARNALRTGNPLWPHHIGGLRSGNGVHAVSWRTVHPAFVR